MTMFPPEGDAGDKRLPDAEPSLPADAATALPAAEPSLSSPPVDADPTPRNPARSSFGDAFAALHDDGPQRHGAALRYSVELLAYYYAAQGRQNPAQEAIRTLVTDRFDILDTPQFGLYAPKGQGAAVADAGLRIMDALNADSVADPVWAGGGADSTEAQRRADYAEQARGGRWVTDITGRHAILRDAQGRSVLAGSNISRVRLKGVPVVGFVMAQADQVQPLGEAAVGGAERVGIEDQPTAGDNGSTGEFDLAQATRSEPGDAMNTSYDVAAVIPPHFIEDLSDQFRGPTPDTPPQGKRATDIADAQKNSKGLDTLPLTADSALLVPSWRDGEKVKRILKYDLEPGYGYTAGLTLIRDRYPPWADNRPTNIHVVVRVEAGGGEMKEQRYQIWEEIPRGGSLYFPFKELGDFSGPGKVTVEVLNNGYHYYTAISKATRIPEDTGSVR